MVKEAESHASEDKDRRQKVEARNQLDSLVYNTEKSFNEHKEKLAAADVGTLESALEAAKKALEDDDMSAIQSATEQLTAASHKLAEIMYKSDPAAAAAAAAAAGGAGAPPGADDGDEGSASAADSDDVIDAEYVDVDSKAS